MKLKVCVGLFIALFLQACSSIEITQSRYGNGIGVSFDKGGKLEEEKTTEFRKRKRDEFMDRTYKVNPKSRGIKTIATKLPIAQKVRAFVPAIQQSKLRKENQEAEKSGEVGIEINSILGQSTGMNAEAQITEESPEIKANTHGNTINLGYLGGLLIIAGLVLLLLGIGQGLSIIILGVVLIILAYFLG